MMEVGKHPRWSLPCWDSYHNFHKPDAINDSAIYTAQDIITIVKVKLIDWLIVINSNLGPIFHRFVTIGHINDNRSVSEIVLYVNFRKPSTDVAGDLQDVEWRVYTCCPRGQKHQTTAGNSLRLIVWLSERMQALIKNAPRPSHIGTNV